MLDDLKKRVKNEMDKAIEAYANELKKVRTGRANVSMLDSIQVNYYGTPTPLNQVSAVSCPDARSFLISPWEASVLKDIETSIVNSSLGMTPMNDGKVIRLKVPELTEQRRKDLAKSVHQIAEDARVSVRMSRRNANDAIKAAEKAKQVSEDEQKRANTEIQKLTDDYIIKIDKIMADKEKDLLSI